MYPSSEIFSDNQRIEAHKTFITSVLEGRADRSNAFHEGESIELGDGQIYYSMYFKTCILALSKFEKRFRISHIYIPFLERGRGLEEHNTQALIETLRHAEILYIYFHEAYYEIYAEAERGEDKYGAQEFALDKIYGETEMLGVLVRKSLIYRTEVGDEKSVFPPPFTFSIYKGEDFIELCCWDIVKMQLIYSSMFKI